MKAKTPQATLEYIFSLYRSILRTHRSRLPTPVREMGDRYVKEEFTSHLRNKNTTEVQWKTFVDEWSQYQTLIASSPSTGSGSGSGGNGVTGDGSADTEMHITGIVDRSGDIPDEIIQQMTPEQVERLQKMREEAVKFGRSFILSQDKENAV